MDSMHASQPSRDAPDPQPDPGRAWRRLARAGAAMTVLAMIVPTGPKRESIAEISL